jgi:hypothetical protein
MPEKNRTLAIGFTICAAPLLLLDLNLLRTLGFLLLSSFTVGGLVIFLVFIAPPAASAFLFQRLWRQPMGEGRAAQHGVGAVMLLAATPVMYTAGIFVLFSLAAG